MARRTLDMGMHSEDIGDWFSRMKVKDLEKLRKLSGYFEEWNDGTLENLYSTFCNKFNDCEWTRVNHKAAKEFEKVLKLEELSND